MYVRFVYLTIVSRSQGVCLINTIISFKPILFCHRRYLSHVAVIRIQCFLNYFLPDGGF